MFGFDFNFDKRYLYIIVGVLVVLSLLSLMNNEGSLIGLVLSIPGLLIAITFHEYAHAFVADKLGDDTPRRQGRLTLNPLDHLDPFGVIMLLFVHIGWGKPVEVNPVNFDRRMTMEKGNALVSIAGPAMNFILAILFTFIYCGVIKFAPMFAINQIGSTILLMIQYTVLLNIGLGVFNLIPLPPLDGSKVIKPFLPYNAKNFFETNERMFYFIFIIIWVTGIGSRIISPIISVLTNWIIQFGAIIFGL